MVIPVLSLEIIISLPVKDNILLRSFMAFAQGLKLVTVVWGSCSIGMPDIVM